MRDGTSRGLAGKARRSHWRGRASQDHYQEAIAEVLEPEHESSGLLVQRPIPIGHRSEFLPSADPTVDIVPASTGMQLELPLTLPDDGHQVGSDGPKTARHQTELPAAAQRVVGTADEARRPGIPVDPRARGTAVIGPQNVSLGGFLFGIILGSAAAAMILVTLMAVFK